MNKAFILLFFLIGKPLFAQNWGLLFPKAIVTNDCQQFSVGTQNGKNPMNEVINSDKTTSLNVQFYLNGQPNDRGNREPYGSILTGDFYDGEHKLYLRNYYYSAPSQMPDKNPVEIKAVITPKGQAPITVTFQFYVLAEHWKFYYVQGLKCICPENSPINPMANLGAACIMEQDFHFTAQTVNAITGEAQATLDGDPEVNKFKISPARPCDPEHFEIAANWGKDVFTKIKDVKARFTGQQMQVDFKIDYMDYLAWKARPLADNKWVVVVPMQKGSKDASGKMVAPLQKEFKKQYLDKTSKLLLHVTSGYELQAVN